MSMTEQEAAYDEFIGNLLDEAYPEHAEQAVAEFTTERLQSFYLKTPLLAQPAVQALVDAREFLASHHANAALVFSATAMEVGLKVAVLKPFVYGLVHLESVATLVAEATTRQNGLEPVQTLLFRILAEHGGVDLKVYRRPGASRPLWEEITIVQKNRNAVVHRAEAAAVADAEQGIAVAAAILEDVFPQALAAIGLHLHDGVAVCGSTKCHQKPDYLAQLVQSLGRSAGRNPGT